MRGLKKPLRRGAWGLALCVGAAGMAQADEYDTINFDVGTSVSYNNNVFYLPAGSDPNVVLKQPSGADTITTTNAGIRLSKPYSLQRFELGFNMVDYKYDRFGFLGFTAKNFNAAWRWSLTPRLHGNLTSTRSETLNTFLDFRSFVRNIRTVESLAWDGEYEIDGVWRLVGGVSKNKVQNEQVIVQLLDLRTDSYEAGLKYAFPSGSSIGAVLRKTQGTYYKLAQPNPVSLTDNRYDEQEVEARFNWGFSGKSFWNSRLAYLRRESPNFSQRNFGGWVGDSTFSWGVTGKTRLVISASRDLASFVSTSASYTQMDKLSIAPTWEVSPKVAVRARYDLMFRDFLGAIANTPTNDRKDVMRTSYLGVDWQPYRWVTLSAFWQNDKRSSNIPGSDFNSTLTSLAAQLTF